MYLVRISYYASQAANLIITIDTIHLGGLKTFDEDKICTRLNRRQRRPAPEYQYGHEYG